MDRISRCPACGGHDKVKAGFVRKEQRYKCKSCGCHFTGRQRGMDKAIKRLAMHLYLEGLGYRAISRVIGVSDVAVAKWINPVKDALIPLRKNRVRVNQLHKLEHFFITKELFNKFGWLLIGTEENRDVCLLGSFAEGNCQIIDT